MLLVGYFVAAAPCWDTEPIRPWTTLGASVTPRALGGGNVLTDFYIAFSTVCFTLLGLWIIVVQTRHGDWKRHSIDRRRAYGVSLHFSVPGLMGLVSLIDPDSTQLWRVSFAIAAVAGAIVLALVRGPAPTWLGIASYVTAILLYVLIAIVALASGIVADLGLSAKPVQVEALLLTALVFLGANVAWLLLFDEASSHASPPDR